jgi:hypothetical protein
LRSPEKNWREHGAEENGRDKISEQSGCVFQGC